MLSSLLAAPAVETWLFYSLSTLAICLAVGVLSDKVVIRSGFILIGVFGTIAGLFLLLSAQFLALAQVMIYAVAITLVIVIALMLTNPKMEADPVKVKTENLPPAGAFFAGIRNNFVLWTAIASFATLYASLTGAQRWPIAGEAVPVDAIKILGDQLTTTYSIPFEFASVLLLAALMGAIMLAKNDKNLPAQSASEAKSAEENLALSR
jgi:NADH:ubiquinone oxidoreductase subunit 6 (subunit J)